MDLSLTKADFKSPKTNHTYENIEGNQNLSFEELEKCISI